MPGRVEARPPPHPGFFVTSDHHTRWRPGVIAESSPLFAVDLPPVPFGSPLEVKEIDLDVPEVVFRRAGVYSWQVVCWGEVIHEKRLVVWLAEGPLIRDARREGPAQEV